MSKPECPHCSTYAEPVEGSHGAVLRCPQCGLTWLDGDEVRLRREYLERMGRDTE